MSLEDKQTASQHDRPTGQKNIDLISIGEASQSVHGWTAHNSCPLLTPRAGKISWPSHIHLPKKTKKKNL